MKYGMNWIVTTTDVDGTSKRKYTSADKARERFEEMFGYPIANAVWDMLPEMDDYPEWTSLPYIKAVSDYGCVVAIEWENTSHAEMPEHTPEVPKPRLQISIVWSVEDVQHMREDLTDEQAYQVLLLAKERHDANVGINWDVLDAWCDHLFPKNN